MDVTLEAIKFNHDPMSATTDAFNIRRNETQPVIPPEWRRRISVTAEQSPAAYAIAETRGNVLTIKAEFTGTANSTVRVRAIEARSDHHRARGCNPIGALLSAFLPVRSARSGNVLGEVKEREIKFDAAGQTGLETFELHNVRLWDTGVSVSNTDWRWQFRAKPADHWTDFALTRHRIYTVLRIPECPWEQTPHDDCNTQLPWADALEYACDWAAGAQDTDEAATLMTRAVYDLGLSLVSYSGSSIYTCPNFDCGKFLDLLQNGTGLGPALNCSDCATIVSSFANLVGCELWQSLIGAVFDTNPIKKIGSRERATTTFSGHEVAWKGEATENDEVFDACLQVDGDDDPSRDPFYPLLATNLRFGTPGEKNYRFRLSPAPVNNGPDLCIPYPSQKQHRPIGISIPGICESFDAVLLDFARHHFKFETWRESDPAWQSLSMPDHYIQKSIFTGWELVSPPQHPKMINVPEVTQAVLRSTGKNPGALLRIDLFRCRTWDEARLFALQRLARFQELNVQRLETPALGDVAFLESGEVSVLFVRSEHVIMVRSVGIVRYPVTEIAVAIDNHFIELTMTQN